VFVERDGQPMEGAARQRRVLALLAVLATAGEAGLSRDRVLGLLWPEGDPDRSRQALTQALYHTRRALGQDDLFITGADLRLNPAVIESDVGEFERLLDRGALEAAVGLYQGPFLDGFYVAGTAEFERWAASERTRLADRCARALDELASAAEGAGDPTTAVEWRKRRAALDPLNSRVALDLMAAMAAAGDRAGAIRHARLHEILLREELDVGPDEAVARLAERLRVETSGIAPAEPAREPVREPMARAAEPAGPAPSLEPPSAPPPIEPPEAQAGGVPAPVETGAVPPDDVEEGWAVVVASDGVASGSTRPLAGAPDQHRWRLAGVVAALIVAVIGVVTIIAVRSRNGGEEPTVAGAFAAHPAIVVAPFRISGADPALAYLHEGMIDLLVTKLTEDDATYAADPGSVLSAWRRAELADRADVPSRDALAVASQLGADRLVLGSVVGTPARMVISASVLGVADGGLRAQATVEGPSDSLTVLVDRLAARLLAKEAGVAERLASHTSTSLAALRAFLEGQAAYRRGSYRLAVQQYRRALDRDSTFAMAGLGLAQAANRIGSRDEQERGLAAAWAARSELTAPDRTFLQALAGPRYPASSSRREMLAGWEHAAAETPPRAGVWQELGEHLFYDGQLLGLRDWSDRATAAFQRAAQLDPTFVAPLQYLVQLSASEGDTAEVRRLAALCAELDSTGDLAAFVRWRSATALGERARLAALRRTIGSMPTPSLRRIVLATAYGGLDPRDAERALAILESRAARRTDRVDALLGRHAYAVDAGRPRRAAAELADLDDLQPASAARLRVLDALYAGGDSTDAVRAAARLTRLVGGDGAAEIDSEAVASRCVLGQWSVWRGGLAPAPPVAALPGIVAPDAAASGLAAACAALVDAVEATRQRHPDAPARLARLDSLLLSSAPIGDLLGYGYLALARLHGELGDARSGLAAARRRPYMREWPQYLAAHLIAEGRLALVAGDTLAALGAFRHLMALRPSPEPAVAGATANVRSLVARLDSASK
jgi:DNA-binding SARP family transcriptional activator